MDQAKPVARLVDHKNLIVEELFAGVGEDTYDFFSNPERLTPQNEWDNISCRIGTDTFQAHFNLQQCPGCCAVLTMSYVNTLPWTQENFAAAVDIVSQAAYRAGFGALVLTQVVPAFSQFLWKREPFYRCLAQGFKASDVFINAKSGHLVTILTKNLRQTGKRDGLEQEHTLIIDPRDKLNATQRVLED
jgi:hypothetical protein